MNSADRKDNGYTRESIELLSMTAYRVLSRTLYLAFALFLTLWFLDAVTLTLLFFALAIIFAIALNPPVTWLEDKGIHRIIGTLAVCLGVGGVFATLGWLVVPQILDQAGTLWENLPQYINTLANRLTDLLPGDSKLEVLFRLDSQNLGDLLPTAQSLLLRVGRTTFTLIGLLFFLIILISIVVYVLINPAPLLKGLLDALPPHHREPMARAFIKGSESVVGWIKSNVIVGSFEAVAATAFLTWMGVPGALIWGSLTFFAEMVPKLGPYLMTIPPSLVAFAVDPMDGLWVLLFYMALNELTSDFIAPMARSSQMDLHPVSLIFSVLALASVFGFLGALISTPLTGFIKAIYEEFYLARHPRDEEADERVSDMLRRRNRSRSEEEANGDRDAKEGGEAAAPTGRDD